MTTKEAFTQLISKRAWYKDAGLDETTGGSIKSRFNNGRLSLEKMDEVLEKAGYKVVQEKLWQI